MHSSKTHENIRWDEKQIPHMRLQVMSSLLNNVADSVREDIIMSGCQQLL